VHGIYATYSRRLSVPQVCGMWKKEGEGSRVLGSDTKAKSKGREIRTGTYFGDDGWNLRLPVRDGMESLTKAFDDHLRSMYAQRQYFGGY